MFKRLFTVINRRFYHLPAEPTPEERAEWCLIHGLPVDWLIVHSLEVKVVKSELRQKNPIAY